VAPNKFLAKIASEQKKPNGLTIISPERVEQFLHALPVRQFPGVGPVTEKKLHSLGILTASDLRGWGQDDLSREFGSFGAWLYRVCRGEDNREVNGNRERHSLGAEDTFSKDIVGLEALEHEVERIACIVDTRLQNRGLSGRTVTLKVTFSDFEKITRSLTFDRSISSASALADVAKGLLQRTEARTGRPVRLIGISVAGFHQPEPAQLLLPFNEPSRVFTRR
jgi:DNA polymerase-4